MLLIKTIVIVCLWTIRTNLLHFIFLSCYITKKNASECVIMRATKLKDTVFAFGIVVVLTLLEVKLQSSNLSYFF